MTIREQIADQISGGRITQLTEQTNSLRETMDAQAAELVAITESLRRLEQVLHSPEWRMLTMQSEREFSRQGLRTITEISRLMYLKNPIIKRGVEVQRLYVFAQGMQISAEDEAINEVIQAFLDDERNQAELTSHQERSQKEADLQQDGNLFFRFFVNSRTGHVRIRTVNPQEVENIVCNPEDAREPFLYKRIYTRTSLDGQTTTPITEYYPDWRYLPRALPSPPSDGPIIWETPIYHVRGNQRLGRWGISEFYSANDWALAYKSFLEQLASVWATLARWAAKVRVKGGKAAIAAAKSKLQTTISTDGQETNPPPVMGSIHIDSGNADIQPFRTAGATMSAEDGRRLFLMVAAVFGLPETFFGDVSVGTLATARSLDRPTELKVIDRQEFWKDVYRQILDFVIKQAIKARRLDGGRVVREPDDDQWIERVVWDMDINSDVEIAFPPIREEDAPQLVGAVVDAATMKGGGHGIPLETAVTELLRILGVDNVDDVMDIWREEEAERQAQAPVVDDEQPSDEDDAMDESLRIMTQAAAQLELVLREAMNGHRNT